MHLYIFAEKPGVRRKEQSSDENGGNATCSSQVPRNR